MRLFRREGKPNGPARAFSRNLGLGWRALSRRVGFGKHDASFQGYPQRPAHRGDQRDRPAQLGHCRAAGLAAAHLDFIDDLDLSRHPRCGPDRRVFLVGGLVRPAVAASLHPAAGFSAPVPLAVLLVAGDGQRGHDSRLFSFEALPTAFRRDPLRVSKLFLFSLFKAGKRRPKLNGMLDACVAPFLRLGWEPWLA
jgi:hypothetical protein